MKKTLWSLAAASALLVALLAVRELGYLSAVKSRYVFDTAQAPSITRLNVSLAGDSVTLVKKTSQGGDGYWVVLPDSFPVDTARMTLVLSHLLRLQDKEIVSKSSDENRLAEFGLSQAEVKVIRWVDASGDAFVIHLGHTSGTDFNSTFWKRPEGAEVYRTPGNFTHEIGVFARDWKDKTLFPAFTPEAVTSLQVRWDDSLGHTVLYTVAVGKDSVYRLTALGRTETLIVPGPTATSLFASAAQLTVDEAPDYNDPDLGLASVDSPSVMLKVTLTDGTSHAFVTGGESGLFYYLHHPVHRGVVKIFKNRVAPFRKTPEQLQKPVFHNPDGVGEYETIRAPGTP